MKLVNLETVTVNGEVFHRRGYTNLRGSTTYVWVSDKRQASAQKLAALIRKSSEASRS